VELQRKENCQKFKSKTLFGLAGPLLHIHLFTLEREMRARNVTFPIVQYVNSHRARHVAKHGGRFVANLTKKKIFKKDWAA
jgi:hypothetical protein